MSATGNRLIKVSFSPRGYGYYLFPPFSLYFPFLRLPLPFFSPSSFFLLLFTPFVSLAVSRDIYTLALFNWRSRRSFARDHCQLQNWNSRCVPNGFNPRQNKYLLCFVSPHPSLVSPFLILFLALLFPAFSPFRFISPHPEFTLLIFILFSLYRHVSVCLFYEFYELNVNLYLSELNIEFHFYPFFLVRTCTFYIHLNLIINF